MSEKNFIKDVFFNSLFEEDYSSYSLNYEELLKVNQKSRMGEYYNIIKNTYKDYPIIAEWVIDGDKTAEKYYPNSFLYISQSNNVFIRYLIDNSHKSIMVFGLIAKNNSIGKAEYVEVVRFLDILKKYIDDGFTFDSWVNVNSRTIITNFAKKYGYYVKVVDECPIVPDERVRGNPFYEWIGIQMTAEEDEDLYEATINDNSMLKMLIRYYHKLKEEIEG